MIYLAKRRVLQDLGISNIVPNTAGFRLFQAEIPSDPNDLHLISFASSALLRLEMVLGQKLTGKMQNMEASIKPRRKYFSPTVFKVDSLL